ncbi:MAG: hypothetical protein IKN55_11030 [Oscillospiraceae bacterium]|nr:hypothetical protein [Oscillospiraceae bacterium]
MRELIDAVVGALREVCGGEVYPGFDAVPLPKKSGRRFTVVETERLALDAPFPDGVGAVHPFTAELRISVLVPMTAPVQRAEELLYGGILPVLETMGAMVCEVQPALGDARLQRTVLRAAVRFRGVYTMEDAQ